MTDRHQYRFWRIIFVTCTALCVIALCPGASSAAGLTLSIHDVGSGADPLVDINPWFAFPNQTKTAMLDVTSVGFSGPVRVAIDCCIDHGTGLTVRPANVYLAFGVPGGRRGYCIWRSGAGLVCPTQLSSTTTVALSPGAKITLPLYVETFFAPTPGQFDITAVAVSLSPPNVISNNVFPILNILPPIPADGALPSACPPSPGGVVVGGITGAQPVLQVLPLMSVTQSLFNKKESDLTQTSWGIGGARTEDSSGQAWAAWNITIGPPPSPLPANTVLVVFKNSTNGWDKEISAFDRRVCPHMVTPHNMFRIRPGQSVAMTVNSTMATTVLLRRQACADWFIWCWDTEDNWQDIAIFSEPNFYYLFGGRMVTIDWFFSQGE
jgi:hypothetical protein